MNAGNSLSIRSFDISKKAWLLAAWAFNQVAGTLRVRSPRLHDQQQGMRWRVTAASTLPLYPGPINLGFKQVLFAQDTLVVEQTGSAVGGQIEGGTLLIGYDDLPGVAARFIDAKVLQTIGVNVVTLETSHTTGVAGGYSGQVAINSSFDNLKANTDYAVLGYLTDTRGVSVRYQSVDFGNLGLGGPSEPAVRDLTNNWFENLSEALNLPWIPVFNSANKAATLVDVHTNQAGGTFIVSTNLVELVPGQVPQAILQTAPARVGP